MTNEEKIKLGTDFESMLETPSWKALNDYIQKDKEAIKELGVNPGFKDYETYKAYCMGYQVYVQIESFIQRAIKEKNKLIKENEESGKMAESQPKTE